MLRTAPMTDPVLTPPSGLVTVESCTTTWAFDTTRGRFARVPRGMPISTTSVEWRPYASMSIDHQAGTLAVALDEAGTRLLRSELHTGAGPCPACGASWA